VELLKDRQETRILHKREARKAKYQKLVSQSQHTLVGVRACVCTDRVGVVVPELTAAFPFL
jgi:hypothetical protein